MKICQVVNLKLIELKIFDINVHEPNYLHNNNAITIKLHF